MKGGEKSMKNNNFLVPVIVAVVVGVLAFYSGVKYQESQATSGVNSAQYLQGQNTNGQRRFGSAGGRGLMGGATIGQIVSVDPTSITIKLKDGSSKIVNIASSTKISKTDVVTQSSLVTGLNVAIIGSVNSDGSITARLVQLNPQVRQKGLNVSPSATQ